jgi:hypothetical protein
MSLRRIVLDSAHFYRPARSILAAVSGAIVSLRMPLLAIYFSPPGPGGTQYSITGSVGRPPHWAR